MSYSNDKLTTLSLLEGGLSRKVLNILPTSDIGWLPERAVIRQSKLKPGTVKAVLFKVLVAKFVRIRTKDGVKQYQRTVRGTKALQ